MTPPVPHVPHTDRMLPECQVYLEALAANYEGHGRAIDHVARRLEDIAGDLSFIRGKLEGRHEGEITGSHPLPAPAHRPRKRQLAINLTMGGAGIALLADLIHRLFTTHT